MVVPDVWNLSLPSSPVMDLVTNNLRIVWQRFTMSNMTEKPARRASWTPPAVPEGNETRSSLRHLRDSLLKDDEVGITGLQKEMKTRLSVFDTAAEQFHPKPRRRGLSSMDSQQENPPNSTNTDIKAATSQSEYVLPWRPEDSSQEPSLYLTMLPIKTPTAAHDKVSLHFCERKLYNRTEKGNKSIT